MLFPGTRELLINVAKQANATRAQMHIGFDASRIEVVAADDGRGFNQAVTAGLGLEGSGDLSLACNRSRIEVLGGRFKIAQLPEAGVLVRIRLPLDPGPPPGQVG